MTKPESDTPAGVMVAGWEPVAYERDYKESPVYTFMDTWKKVDSDGKILFEVKPGGQFNVGGHINHTHVSMSPATPQISVLDKGYVRLVDSMGSDLSVVNAARVSYDKESHEFDDKDSRLVAFLARERHTAPFRHGIAQFEVYAPLFVARQWWKHVIGGTQAEYPESQSFFAGMDPFTAWNESSRRYVTEDEVFYEDFPWRAKPANNKQGSAGNVDAHYGAAYTEELKEHNARGLELYRKAMADGIAPEQARLFLGANGLYVRWRWTSSLQGIMHFIDLRDESHAQKEIQDYAKAVRALTAERFPVSIGSMDESAR